ncbi:MAG: cell wall hydrolase [Nanoarchaeota archaeon]|nr:cell wall hydrolase [Nanoarchaeota archaeon]
MTLKNKLKRAGMAILAVPLIYGIGWLAINGQKTNPVNTANASPNSNLEAKVVQEADTNANEPNSLSYVVEEKPVEEIETPNTKVRDIDYKTDNFSKDSNNVLLARMLYGETRNCSKEEKIAVAYTVINRANDNKKWNGENVKEVILKPWQYSCFNKNDANYEKLKDPINDDADSFYDCLKVANEVLQGKHSELNKGQTHYFNPKVVKPKWADEMYKIGKIKNSKHEFYIEN